MIRGDIFSRNVFFPRRQKKSGGGGRRQRRSRREDDFLLGAGCSSGRACRLGEILDEGVAECSSPKRNRESVLELVSTEIQKIARGVRSSASMDQNNVGRRMSWEIRIDHQIGRAENEVNGGQFTVDSEYG